MNFLTKFKKPARGIAILSLIFILTPMILVAVLGETLLSVNQNFDSVDTESGLRARSYADVAVKEALLRLARDYKLTYNKPVELPLADGGASFQIINDDELGLIKRILAQGQFSEAIKNLQILVTLDTDYVSPPTIIWSSQRQLFPDFCHLADFSGDNRILVNDLMHIKNQRGCDVFTEGAVCYEKDLNLDGVVDALDIHEANSCHGWPF